MAETEEFQSDPCMVDNVNSSNNANDNVNTVVKYAVGGGILAALTLTTIFAGPVILGFTSAGIVSGSVAAWIMSLSGGATQAGGLCAVLQSAGATAGLSPFELAIGAIGAAVANWFQGLFGG
ncbi:hypothetical protein DM01DRAFT_314145 [Hesseltinella vesiculosa]|uniref:Uncharacterized protein n=1 Tax=Hesseltinella vesiculosa TaxID=101127 RepID=A0A1X2G781_9FUNG|nr:hypothetical protein DM01DRAFT_314145 [Hesseltinella vesiculosa]